MLRSSLRIALLVLVFTGSVSAQFTVSSLAYLRGARNVALGQAAVAVARGTDAVFVNAARLASFEGYGLMIGSGEPLPFVPQESAMDMAVAGAIVPGRLGMGLSYSSTNLDLEEGRYSFESQAGIHAGYRLLDWLDVGVQASYYYLHSRVEQRSAGNTLLEIAEPKSSTVDLGIAAHSSFDAALLPGDELSFGIQAVNLLDPKIEPEVEGTLGSEKTAKYRYVRIGAAWSIPCYIDAEETPSRPRLLLGAGAAIVRSSAETSHVLPGLTMAASFYDLVTLSWNFEADIADDGSPIPSYPLHRFGILSDLPVGDWLGLGKDLRISLDYCYCLVMGDMRAFVPWRGNDDWNRSIVSLGILYHP